MIADCGHPCTRPHIDLWDATTRCPACQDAREQAQWRQAREEEIRAYHGDGMATLTETLPVWREGQR